MPGFRIGELAQADLEGIARYTKEQWGREQRDRYLLGIEGIFRTLSLNPTMTAERQDFSPPVRIYPHEKHLIIYTIDDSGILIIRVLHQSMDIPPHLSH